MIKILEGPLRDVEKLANAMEAEGWCPLGPAQFTGVHQATGARMVVMTMLKRMEAPTSEDKYWTSCSYELNSVGAGDE